MLHRCDKCHASTFNNHHYKDMCFAEISPMNNSLFGGISMNPLHFTLPKLLNEEER